MIKLSNLKYFDKFYPDIKLKKDYKLNLFSRELPFYSRRCEIYNNKPIKKFMVAMKELVKTHQQIKEL